MRENGVFCVNTLGAEAEAIAEPWVSFFRRPHRAQMEERFQLGTWSQLVTGAPVLTTAVVRSIAASVDVKAVASHNGSSARPGASSRDHGDGAGLSRPRLQARVSAQRAPPSGSIATYRRNPARATETRIHKVPCVLDHCCSTEHHRIGSVVIVGPGFREQSMNQNHRIRVNRVASSRAGQQKPGQQQQGGEQKPGQQQAAARSRPADPESWPGRPASGRRQTLKPQSQAIPRKAPSVGRGFLLFICAHICGATVSPRSPRAMGRLI